METEIPDFLTISEAAREARVSESAIRQAIDGKRLPAFRRGRNRYILRADIESYNPRNYRERMDGASPAGRPKTRDLPETRQT
jgi:excisionase family DNA binding protein